MLRALARCAGGLVLLALLPAAVGSAQEAAPPKVDIFGGYAFAHPGQATVNNTPLKNVAGGWGAAFTYHATRRLGFTVDTGAHYGDQFRMGTITFGPKLQFTAAKVTPFLEALFGLHRLTFLGLDPDNNAGLVLGGGLDLPVHPRVDFRVLQADYVWGHHNFSPLVPGTTNLNGIRLRSGIVFKFGQLGPPPVPMSAVCSALPSEVYDGEPVAVTVTAQNVPRNHAVTYGFAGAGRLTARENTATVDTTGLAPGNYTVTGTVTDPRARKNATPASCVATFTVKERPKHPPTITCSASAPSVIQGEPVTIACTGQSVDQRPLTYEWNASAGKLSPIGATATLDTVGVTPGPVNVQTTVKDDRTPPLTASTTTTISVTAPLQPQPQPRKLNEIAFKLRSARVDNVAKAILDDIALVLQREADSRAVIVGFFDPAQEKGRSLAEALAAQRAVNIKAYLVQEKGIEPGRIEVRYGTAGGTRAEIWLVPPGAGFDAAGSSPVDESRIKPARTVRRHARPARR